MTQSHRMLRRGITWAAAGTAALAAVAGGAPPSRAAHRSAARPPAAARGWVNAWQGSPTAGGTFSHAGCPADTGLTAQTVRNIVVLSAGGHELRVRVSNAFGALPLQVGAASVGVQGRGAAVVPGTLRTLRFSGLPPPSSPRAGRR